MKYNFFNFTLSFILIDYYISKNKFLNIIDIYKLHFISQDIKKSLSLSEKSKIFYSYFNQIKILKSIINKLFHKNNHFNN